MSTPIIVDLTEVQNVTSGVLVAILGTLLLLWLIQIEVDKRFGNKSTSLKKIYLIPLNQFLNNSVHKSVSQSFKG